MNQLRINQLNDFCQAIGVSWKTLPLLDTALTHTSYANEAKGKRKPVHNERLEFLGDSVLGMAVAGYLYRQFPNLPEGDLTRIRAKVVCETTLAKVATEYGLGGLLRLGRGEELSGGRERHSILADALEAVFGAAYLDGGFAHAERIVLQFLAAVLAGVDMENGTEDYKTLLQELAQRDAEAQICYRVVAERGPDHNKTFSVSVEVNGKPLGFGEGHSKKEAEQRAAREAVGMWQE